MKYFRLVNDSKLERRYAPAAIEDLNGITPRGIEQADEFRLITRHKVRGYTCYLLHIISD
jgi:hypothetical protein